MDRCRRCQQCVWNRLACQGERRQGHLSDRHFLVQPQTVDRPGIGDIAACLGSLASGDLLKRRHDVGSVRSGPIRPPSRRCQIRCIYSRQPAPTSRGAGRLCGHSIDVESKSAVLYPQVAASSSQSLFRGRRAANKCTCAFVVPKPSSDPPADSQSWRFRFSWWFWGLWSAQLTRRHPRTAAFWGPLRAHQREGQQELGWNVVTFNRHFHCLRYPP